MSLLTDEQIKAFVEKPANAGIIDRAKGIRNQHRRHIEGVGVDSFLEIVETYENKDQWELRKKLAQAATVPIFSKELQTFNKVFSAQGTAKHYKFFDQESELVGDFIDYLNTDIGGGFNMNQWMQRVWLKKLNVDSTGLLMVEIPPNTAQRPEPFVKYRSIDQIHDIGFNGMKVEYLILKVKIRIEDVLSEPELAELKAKKQTEGVRFFRYIDDRIDAIVMMKDGKATILDTDEFPIIPNFWGYVPAIFLSSAQDSVTRAKTSYVWESMPVADEYLIDASVHSISKKLHGFPQRWEQERACRQCKGDGYFNSEKRNDDGEFDRIDCSACNGIGIRLQSDTSDVVVVPKRESADEPYDVPPGGYIPSPFEILREQREEQVEIRKLIRIAIWANPDRAFFQQSGSSETATGRTIDVGEVHDKLNMVSENAEMVEKFLTDTIGFARYGTSIFMGSVIKYGRTYLILSADQIEKEYIAAKAGGVPVAQLAALRNELVHVKYQNDPFMLEKQLKLQMLEPLPDLSIDEANALASVSESDKMLKTYFNDYIERFEQEVGTITFFSIDVVKNKILEYNTEKLASQQQQPIQEQPTIEIVE